MSIVTGRGDGGETSLPEGTRVSKAAPRIEAAGEIDELISFLGLARALCPNAEIRELTKSIQRELFRVGSAVGATHRRLGRPERPERPEPDVSDEMVDRLTQQAHRIESIEGILADWSLPGEDAAAAAYDVGRTVCRRAERRVVALTDSGIELEPNAVRYLNRLSDLLWLFSRQIELERGADSRLRQESSGSRWSRAW